MKVPKLVANEYDGEGYMLVPDEWLQADPLLRADILKDWIYSLENQYESALIELKAQSVINKAMIKNEQNTKGN